VEIVTDHPVAARSGQDGVSRPEAPLHDCDTSLGRRTRGVAKPYLMALRSGGADVKSRWVHAIPKRLVLSVLIIITPLSAFLLDGCLSPHPTGETATPFNDFVTAKPADLDFLDVELEAAEPIQEWQLRVPWSRDGLGGADRYLGMDLPGEPVGGGADPPEIVLIGPGPVIAIESRDCSRLYDPSGRFLRLLPGRPVGFTSRGELVTAGGEAPLQVFSPDGALLWRANPPSDFESRLDLAEGILVGSSLDCFVSPDGSVYVSINSWTRDHEIIVALLVYSSMGELLSCCRVPRGFHLLFTHQGTVFAHPVRVDKGLAHREFKVDKDTFTLIRTIYVPSGTIAAIGWNGSVVCYEIASQADLHYRFTVYEEGVGRALSFTFPSEECLVAWTPDGRLYTQRVTAEAFVLTAWIWPTP